MLVFEKRERGLDSVCKRRKDRNRLSDGCRFDGTLARTRPWLATEKGKHGAHDVLELISRLCSGET